MYTKGALRPHQLMYFEGLEGVTQDRVCRGANQNDNQASYFTVYWTSTLEGCKSQCVEVPDCKGTPDFKPFQRVSKCISAVFALYLLCKVGRKHMIQ